MIMLDKEIRPANRCRIFHCGSTVERDGITFYCPNCYEAMEVGFADAKQWILSVCQIFEPSTTIEEWEVHADALLELIKRRIREYQEHLHRMATDQQSLELGNKALREELNRQDDYEREAESGKKVLQSLHDKFIEIGVEPSKTLPFMQWGGLAIENLQSRIVKTEKLIKSVLFGQSELMDIMTGWGCPNTKEAEQAAEYFLSQGLLEKHESKPWYRLKKDK
jgi:hypothetical protein